MGLGGISIWQLLIVLAIVIMLFGTKRLRGLGGDLGGALKGFKTALSEDEDLQSSSAENLDHILRAQDDLNKVPSNEHREINVSNEARP